MTTDPDALIEAAAAQIGLTIADAYRPGVRRFLGIAAEMAATLDDVELDNAEAALAPIYSPPDSGE